MAVGEPRWERTNLRRAFEARWLEHDALRARFPSALQGGQVEYELDDIDQTIRSIDESLKTLAGGRRRGSRFVGDGAQRSLVEHVAKGGSYSLAEGSPTRPVESRSARGGLAAAML